MGMFKTQIQSAYPNWAVQSPSPDTVCVYTTILARQRQANQATAPARQRQATQATVLTTTKAEASHTGQRI